MPRRVRGGQSTALLPHQLETRKNSGYRGPSQPVIPRPINRAKKATGAWPNGLGFTIKLAGGEAWVTGRAGCLLSILVLLDKSSRNNPLNREQSKGIQD